MRIWSNLFLTMFVVWFGSPGTAVAAEQEYNHWSLIRFDHRFDDDWGAQFQTEVRMKDNISRFGEWIVKPSVVRHFSESVSIALGYKHIDKSREANEQDIWQELILKHPFNILSFTHQVRLEERFINGISGVIPRLRYLVAVTYPLSSDLYLAASQATRFNLVSKGTGPVGGFEQNRLYFGVGLELSAHTKFETGYLWRYERQRSGPDKSDHVLRFQVLVQTDSRGRTYTDYLD